MLSRIKTKYRVVTFALLSSSLLIASCAGVFKKEAPVTAQIAPELAPIQETLLQNIQAFVDDHGVEGLSVVMVNDEDVLITSNHGWASRTDERPYLDTTPTLVASVSKLFTAMAIMQLVEQDRLDLDAPIIQYLPELKARKKPEAGYAEPTLRSLLTHHSGLQSDLFDDIAFPENWPSDWSTHYRSLLVRADELQQAHPPQTILSYSNIAYSLLAIVVERASGVSFHDYVENELFEPMGLTSATFAPADSAVTDMVFGLDGRDEIPFKRVRDVAAGGLAISTRDLATFGQVLLNEGKAQTQPILKPETLKTMWQIQNADIELDQGQPIGLGFWRASSKHWPASIPMVFHGGDDAPYHALSATLPDHDLSIALTTNSGVDSMLLQKLSETLFKAVLAFQGIDTSIESVSLKLTDNHLPVGGVYSLPFGHGVLTQKTDSHYAFKTGLFNAKVSDNEDGTWSLGYRLFGWIPLPVDDIAAMTFRFESLNDQSIIWMYVNGIAVGPLLPAAPQSISNSWLDRQGIYRAEKSDTYTEYDRVKVEWLSDHQQLLAGPYLGFGMDMMYPVSVLDDARVRTQGLGRNLGEEIQWLDESRLVFSGTLYVKE